MSLTKVLAVTVDTVTRQKADGSSKAGAGKYQHLLVGKDGSYYDTSYLKPTLNWTGLTGGGKIVKATLVLYSDDLNPPASTPRIYIRRCKDAFAEGSSASFVANNYTTSAVTGAILGIMEPAHDAVNRIDITAFMNIWAPKTVKQSNGNPGTNPGTGSKRTDYGVALTKYNTATAYAWSGWSSDYTAHPEFAPSIELEYEEGLTVPATPVNLLPSGDTDSLVFEGDFSDSRPQDKLASTDIEVYPAAGGASATIGTNNIVTSAAHGLPVNTPIIFTALTGGAGLVINKPYYVRDITTNTFKVALAEGGAAIDVTVAASAATWQRRFWVTPVSYPASETDILNAHFAVIPSGLVVVAGTTYKFRARVHDSPDGSVSLWTTLQSFTLTNNPPDVPVIAPDGAAFDALNGVVFSGAFTDDDPADFLGAYQIQLASAPPDDAAEELNFWDTGRVQMPYVTDNIFRAPYGGAALLAGGYNWRARVWDNRGAVSDWAEASLTLNLDFDPEPGSQTIRQIDPQAPWRIRIHAMERLAFGGNITGVASTDLFTSASSHGLAVGNTVYFTALTGGAGLVVGTPYYIIASGLLATKFKLALAAGGTAVNFTTTLTAATMVRATRGPGELLLVMENAKSVGAAEMYNAPGEAHWTLPIDDPRVGTIEPKQTHYAIDFYSGDGWRETFAGLVWDADATETSVVYTGLDYLALFDLNSDERFSVSRPDLPTTKGGNKYVRQTIKAITASALALNIALPDSPTGFIGIGAIATQMTEQTTIYAVFIPTLQFIVGLMDSHRQGTGKNTRVSVYKDSTGHYKVKVEDNPGVERNDLRMSYGEMVQGFRVIVFGPNWLSRINSIGRVRDGAKVMYKTANAPGLSQAVFGRISQARMFDGVTDENDMIRRQKQAVLHQSKLGAQMALGYRNGVLQPKDGFAVTDQIPVSIVEGAIDTTRFGSGFWVIYGITWEANDDGSAAVINTLLPRDDLEEPDANLLDSKPTNPAEWQLRHGPPNGAPLLGSYATGGAPASGTDGDRYTVEGGAVIQWLYDITPTGHVVEAKWSDNGTIPGGFNGYMDPTYSGAYIASADDPVTWPWVGIGPTFTVGIGGDGTHVLGYSISDAWGNGGGTFKVRPLLVSGEGTGFDD